MSNRDPKPSVAPNNGESANYYYYPEPISTKLLLLHQFRIAVTTYPLPKRNLSLSYGCLFQGEPRAKRSYIIYRQYYAFVTIILVFVCLLFPCQPHSSASANDEIITHFECKPAVLVGCTPSSLSSPSSSNVIYSVSRNTQRVTGVAGKIQQLMVVQIDALVAAIYD